MGPPSSREVIKLLENDGWELVAIRGDHHQFKHPEKPGKVTVRHPVKQLGWADWSSIKRQAGWK